MPRHHHHMYNMYNVYNVYIKHKSSNDSLALSNLVLLLCFLYAGGLVRGDIMYSYLDRLKDGFR